MAEDEASWFYLRNQNNVVPSRTPFSSSASEYRHANGPSLLCTSFNQFVSVLLFWATSDGHMTLYPGRKTVNPCVYTPPVGPLNLSALGILDVSACVEIGSIPILLGRLSGIGNLDNANIPISVSSAKIPMARRMQYRSLIIYPGRNSDTACFPLVSPRERYL